MVQPNFNSWVGTSVGLFAEGKAADFDRFVCKDAYSPIEAAGYSNYFGVEKVNADERKAVTNTSGKGGWLMISGLTFGQDKAMTGRVELLAAAVKGGNIAIWLDDPVRGRKIAGIAVSATGGKNVWKTFDSPIKNVSGSHDVFIKFPAGTDHDILIRQLVFKPNK
jgi:xylan 1,4-beta-xylosidase